MILCPLRLFIFVGDIQKLIIQNNLSDNLLYAMFLAKKPKQAAHYKLSDSYVRKACVFFSSLDQNLSSPALFLFIPLSLHVVLCSFVIILFSFVTKYH